MAAKSSPWQEEWELIPSNTSFLEFGLEDIKDLISTEIEYMDYLREEHLVKPIQDQEEKEQRKPHGNRTANTNQTSHKMMTAVCKEFVSTMTEDQKQSCKNEISRDIVVKDKESATVEEEKEKEKENSAGSGLAASISMLISVAAAAATAACVLMLGGGLQHQQRRREESLRFQIYADNKALKRLNQALVPTGREPAAEMRTASISFGGFFNGL